MNFTSNISEKIKNISVEKNIIHIGEVKKFDGNIVYTDPFPAPIGSLCLIHDCNKNKIMSEVISFDEKYNMLAVLGQNPNLIIGCKVQLIDDGKNINIDERILGRITDAFGNPLDDKPIDKMNEAINIYPYSSTIYQTLGSIYQSQFDYLNALKYYKKSFELNNNEELGFLILNLYKEVGQGDSAFNFLEKLSDMYLTAATLSVIIILLCLKVGIFPFGFKLR